LAQAIAEATAGRKNIFVVFGASWCGWCRKLDEVMNQPLMKGLFGDNYVILHLKMDENSDKKYLETPGAEVLSQQYGGQGQGLPYWVILDSTGRYLADSRFESSTSVAAGNIGCPATVEEVSYFIKVLRKTSLLSAQDLYQIGQQFLQNKE
jgi:hypothetical protein